MFNLVQALEYSFEDEGTYTFQDIDLPLSSVVVSPPKILERRSERSRADEPTCNEEESGCGTLIDAANGHLEAVNGDLEAVNANLEAANGDLIAADGDLVEADCDLVAPGCDLVEANGNLFSANGNVVASNGDLDAGDGDLRVAENVSLLLSDLSTTNDYSITKLASFLQNPQSFSQSNLTSRIVLPQGDDLSPQRAKRVPLQAAQPYEHPLLRLATGQGLSIFGATVCPFSPFETHRSAFRQNNPDQRRQDVANLADSSYTIPSGFRAFSPPILDALPRQAPCTSGRSASLRFPDLQEPSAGLEAHKSSLRKPPGSLFERAPLIGLRPFQLLRPLTLRAGQPVGQPRFPPFGPHNGAQHPDRPLNPPSSGFRPPMVSSSTRGGRSSFVLARPSTAPLGTPLRPLAGPPPSLKQPPSLWPRPSLAPPPSLGPPPSLTPPPSLWP